jgi:beta-N-acetylhexosaminidase
MVGVEGRSLSVQEREWLAHPSVGGVILFSRNYVDPVQLTDLVASIKAIKSPELLVAVDQEGGRVQRFVAGFTPLPAQHQIGVLFENDPTGAEELAWILGRVMGLELRAVDIDISFAPVVDLFKRDSNAIGDRAFHSDPDVVICLAGALCAGMRASGITSIVKHYPGHGGVTADSHVTLPVDPRSIEAIRSTDLKPYSAYREVGFKGLMTSHVMYPAIDNQPATFSTRWIQEILREDFGFTAAVFSDDLNMAAAQTIEDIHTRVLYALTAGCDMILLCDNTADLDAVLERAPCHVSSNGNLRLETLYGSEPEHSHQNQLADWCSRLVKFG